MELVVLITLAVVLAAAIHFLMNRRFKAMVDKIPGPASLPILGNTWHMWKLNFELIKIQDTFFAKYGPVFRLKVGPRVIVFLLDETDVEVVLISNKLLDKSDEYSLLHPWTGRGLLTSTGQRWHSHRKLLTPTFHFKVLEQFVDVFHKNSTIMADKFLEQNGRPFNVYKLMSLCTLDIICETAMGTSMNAQNQSESEYVKAVTSACSSMMTRVLQVWLQPDLVFNLSSVGKTFNEAVDTMHRTTQEVIRRRQEERARNKNNPQNGPSKSQHDDEDTVAGAKKKIAFLDHLLNANDAAGSGMTDTDIREEVDTFMFAGHDTTGAALTFALFLLAAHPDVQEKAAQEVLDVMGDSDRPTTHQDLQNMTYIGRVIKETLRMYPSVPAIAREATEDISLPSGHVIPAGCAVNVAIYNMGRNPSVWPDPEKFDPDRFLPENLHQRHPFAYVPFSAGPRNCIGQKFAMLEMKSTVANALRKCELLLPEPDYKPRVLGMVVLKLPDGLMMQARPRKRV